MNLKGRDFLTLADFDKEGLTYLLDIASRLKQDNRIGQTHHLLKNKNLILIFSKPSLRTRVSFEVGIRQLGGDSLVLKQDEINLGVRESIADTARVLSRYADGVMIRTFAHSDVEEFAKFADIPVINGLTDSSHPCQIMADLLTIKEKFGDLENLKLSYIGDGNNIAHSLLLGCSIMGMDVSICCPEGYDPDTYYLNKAEEFADISGSKIQVTNNPKESMQHANIVYTDVWASMGQEAEALERKKIFAPYQVNSELLSHASSDVIVLHCLPAHRGEEITEEVLEKYSHVIFEQAENRLHAQKAIMASIM
jgi:ornithine carbamoyltransferase